MSDSLWPHGLQHARPPCLSPTPGVYSNSCLLSQWCHPTISSSVVPFASCPQSFSASGVLSNESALHMRWPKYWSFSFSISFSNEHPGLISFRMDWLDLLAVQRITIWFVNPTTKHIQTKPYSKNARAPSLIAALFTIWNMNYGKNLNVHRQLDE